MSLSSLPTHLPWCPVTQYLTIDLTQNLLLGFLPKVVNHALVTSHAHGTIVHGTIYYILHRYLPQMTVAADKKIAFFGDLKPCFFRSQIWIFRRCIIALSTTIPL